MEWWERVSKLLEQRSMSAAELARAAGIHEKMIYKYIDGKVSQPRGDALARLAFALQTTERFLRYGAETEMPTLSRATQVPLLRLTYLSRLRPGDVVFTVWDKVSFVSVSHDGSADSFVVRVDDDCGLPEFKPGDDILCDPSAPLVPGRFVVAVSIAGRTAVLGRYKPLAMNGTPCEIIPPNSAYPSVRINTPADGFIVARAIRHIRDI